MGAETERVRMPPPVPLGPAFPLGFILSRLSIGVRILAARQPQLKAWDGVSGGLRDLGEDSVC